MRLAYENILDLALETLMETATRRMALGPLVAELLDLIDVPDSESWREYSAGLIAGFHPSMAARRTDEAMVEVRTTGDRSSRMRSAVALVAALIARAAAFGELLHSALNAPDHFHSLKTEVRFLRDRNDESTRRVIEVVIRERVLKRHLWVASRKFRN